MNSVFESPTPQITNSPHHQIPKFQRQLSLLRWWADLLDSRFRIPGTEIRFGIDPLLSLIPGFGDLASPVFAMVLITQGLVMGLPKLILVRMLINALFDAMVGAVPVAGNVADIFWRSNTINVALLERHARPGHRPASGDYFFVFTIAALFGVLVFLPVVLAIWLTAMLWGWTIGT